MKRLLLLSLVLTACAPALQTAQGTQNTLTVVSPGVLLFANRDADEAVAPVVAVIGVTRVYGEGATCTAVERGATYCRLPNVPAGSGYRLAFEGALEDANATWRTPSGQVRAIVLSDGR